jgi:hypothetical protein
MAPARGPVTAAAHAVQLSEMKVRGQLESLEEHQKTLRHPSLGPQSSFSTMTVTVAVGLGRDSDTGKPPSDLGPECSEASSRRSQLSLAASAESEDEGPACHGPRPPRPGPGGPGRSCRRRGRHGGK